MIEEKRIVLTGFMGVGKSTVARFLASLLDSTRIDLDTFIENSEKKTIAELIKTEGEAQFRQIETANLRRILAESEARVIALGGGAWTMRENRQLIRERDLTTVWLESTFDHCWRNIKMSKRERPLAANREQTQRLFDERAKLYCLADWHFIIRPDFTSFDVARKIAEEVFSVDLD